MIIAKAIKQKDGSWHYRLFWFSWRISLYFFLGFTKSFFQRWLLLLVLYYLFRYFSSVILVWLFECPGPWFVRSLVGLTASVETAHESISEDEHPCAISNDDEGGGEILWIRDPYLRRDVLIICLFIHLFSSFTLLLSLWGLSSLTTFVPTRRRMRVYPKQPTHAPPRGENKPVRLL